MQEIPKYKRVLIKLSGEVMAGEGRVGIDPTSLRSLALEIKELHDLSVEIALVIGGGNLIRGASATGYDIERVTADQVGMLTTIINGLFLRDLLERIGISTTLQSAVPIGEMVAPYERVSAIKDLRDKTLKPVQEMLSQLF